MLTNDLVRVRLARGGSITPTFIDPTSDDLLQAAQLLVTFLTEAAQDGLARSEVDAGIVDLVGNRRDQKLVRGLAKLLLDRCTFEVVSPLPPVDLRERVFRAAAEAGGVSLQAGPLGNPTADTVLEAVGSELGMDAEQVRTALYGDLPDEQRLTTFDARPAQWLLHRYNVSLVQSVLLHATEVTITLEEPTVPRIRQLMRWAKFYQLVHRAERNGSALTLTLDGPGSIFHKSSRYGMQLATFFPALLLQDALWTLRAQVRWKRSDRTLELSQTDGLVSHYRDTGNYETQLHEWFVERFGAQTDCEWTLDRRVRPIDLGGRSVVMPDYRLTRDGKTAWLEIIGYWRKDYLDRRLEALRRHGPGNLILAVSKNLGKKTDLSGLGSEVVPFAKILQVKDVLEAAERVAR